jgi:hypothetical protein
MPSRKTAIVNRQSAIKSETHGLAIMKRQTANVKRERARERRKTANGKRERLANFPDSLTYLRRPKFIADHR